MGGKCLVKKWFFFWTNNKICCIITVMLCNSILNTKCQILKILVENSTLKNVFKK